MSAERRLAGPPRHGLGWPRRQALAPATRRPRSDLQRIAAALDAGRFSLLALDGDLRVAIANDTVCETVGASEHALIGRPFRELLHHDERGWVEPELTPLLDGRRDHLRREVRLVTASGADLWGELSAHAGQVDAGPGVIAVLETSAYGALHLRELRRLADTDPLTDLLNRRRFNVELERHLLWTRRYGAVGALLLIDIDGLKAINDTHGHPAGDAAIVSTARRLRDRVRETDFAARYGGDEFALLLPAARADDAVTVALALLEHPPLGHHDDMTPLSLSIGIACVTPESQIGDLLERADQALYLVKRCGGEGYAMASGRADAAAAIVGPVLRRGAAGSA